MAELRVSRATTTDLSGTVQKFKVDGASLDVVNGAVTMWDFPQAKENLAYYDEIPEYNSALNNLKTWVVGKGFTTQSTRDQAILDRIVGWGKESAKKVFGNIFIMSKIMGDGFAEIIRIKGEIVNIKPLSAERMRMKFDKNGMIDKYEYRKGNKWEPLRTDQVFHISNERIGDEIHGRSAMRVMKWIIDARNEALATERMLRKRQLALGVLYVDEDKASVLNSLTVQYQNAINNGEVLVLPEKTARLDDQKITRNDNLEWIRYLESFFYQTIKVPRVIATSEGFTEAGGKVGYVTFEPIYTSEQSDLEDEIWSQLQIRLKFNRPPALGGTVQEDEEKNTGQLGFQPNDLQATVERE